MRKVLGLLLAGGMLVGAVAAAHAATPVKVFTDAAGDAGNQDSGVPGFDQVGFDLVGGSIVKNGANLDFTVTEAAMPPNGALPEGFRFLWDFGVNGTEYRVTVKSADIGKPNPVNQEDTDRVGKVDPTGFYRLEGKCSSDATLPVTMINCHTLGYLTGKFDAASKSFTFSVPMAAVGAKTGSLITAGAGDGAQICSICWVTHAGERSLNTSIIDSAAQSVSYKVPRK
jgi:hypothetical protein